MAIEYITAGESHGEMLAGIIKGIPAGLGVDSRFIDGELSRRQLGYGRGERMNIERDRAKIISGVINGTSIGSPIAILIDNAARDRADKLTAVRPGHADLSGVIKYGFSDASPVAERASARETAMRVALGAVAKLYLKTFGIAVESRTVAIGKVGAEALDSYTDINARADKDAVRCIDAAASKRMRDEIALAKERGDTLGGVAEVTASGVVAGIGSYVSSDLRLDGLIMREVGSVPSVKAVEIGDGIDGSTVFGSEFHDRIYAAENGKYIRMTNRAGGIEGGMTNGERITVRAYFKPVPTLANGLDTVDIITGKNVKAAALRSDVCIVPAGGVAAEAAVALALCSALSTVLGGDTMDEAIERYRKKRSAE